MIEELTLMQKVETAFRAALPDCSFDSILAKHLEVAFEMFPIQLLDPKNDELLEALVTRKSYNEFIDSP